MRLGKRLVRSRGKLRSREDRVSEARSENHSFPQFPHTPTHHLADAFPPAGAKSPIHPQTHLAPEPFLAEWQEWHLRERASLTLGVYSLADVVENVVRQVEVFQVLRSDKDLRRGRLKLNRRLKLLHLNRCNACANSVTSKLLLPNSGNCH